MQYLFPKTKSIYKFKQQRFYVSVVRKLIKKPKTLAYIK